MSFDQKHILQVQKRLLAWYWQHARDLPWRKTKNPYCIWISEMMLQQTQVETVKPYYRRFIRALPDIGRLATASEGQVLKLWEGLGYYRRAGFLHQAAKILVRERGGEFPKTCSEWKELPGIGPYMAGALASIISGECVAAVDGNVERIMARLLALEGDPTRPAAKSRIREAAEHLVPAHSAGDFNQALMDLGAGICRPREPLCGSCPIGGQCAAKSGGQPENYPARKQKKRVPHYLMAAAVILKQGKYLVGQRPAAGLLGGLWEFPAVRIKEKETAAQALRRMSLTHLGAPLRIGAWVGTVEHGYTHFSITVRVYLCALGKANPESAFHAHLRWTTAAQAKLLPFSRVNGKIWEMLEPAHSK